MVKADAGNRGGSAGNIVYDIIFASLRGLLYGYGMKLWVQVDLETFKIPFGIML